MTKVRARMRKMDHQTSKKWYLVAFLFCFVVLAATTLTKPLAQDEGVFLTIARGMIHGSLPYRDFFDHKPPGIYFVLAAVGVLGHSVFIPKILTLLINLVTIGCTAFLAKKLRLNGYVAAIAFTLGLIFFEGNYILAEPFLALCLVIATLFLIKKESGPNYFLAGIFLGLAIAFKQTAVINLLIVIAILFYERKFRLLLYLIFGTVLLALPFFAYFYGNSIEHEAFRQIVVLNFSNYPRESIRAVFSGLLLSFFQTLPIWVLFISGLIKSRNRKGTIWILFFSLLPIPLFLVRHYPHYWIQILPFVAIISALGYEKFNRKVLIVSAGYFLVTLLFVTKQIFWQEKLLNEQLAAGKYVKSIDSSMILCENQFSPLYYLAEKEPINKYLYITEIDDWSEQAEQKTIDDLQLYPVTPVIWTENRNFAYAKKLQSYIFESYIVEKEYPENGLLVLRRK